MHVSASLACAQDRARWHASHADLGVQRAAPAAAGRAARCRCDTWTNPRTREDSKSCPRPAAAHPHSPKRQRGMQCNPSHASNESITALVSQAEQALVLRRFHAAARHAQAAWEQASGLSTSAACCTPDPARCSWDGSIRIAWTACGQRTKPGASLRTLTARSPAHARCLRMRRHSAATRSGTVLLQSAFEAQCTAWADGVTEVVLGSGTRVPIDLVACWCAERACARSAHHAVRGAHSGPGCGTSWRRGEFRWRLRAS